MIDLGYIFTIGLKDGLIWFPIILGIGILYSHLKLLDISIDGIVISSGIVCGFVWNYTNSYFTSIIASVAAGIIFATIVCFLIFRLRIHPIMSGIIFSLAAHSLSVVFVGESILLSETKLISGILVIPLWLIFVGLLLAIGVEFFFSHGLGVEIRAFGDNNQINTRRNPLFLAFTTYALVGGLYGLGAAMYSHSEGLARSGGSFDFLIIGLTAYLSVDRIIRFLSWTSKKKRNGYDHVESYFSVIHKSFIKFWALVSTKAFLGIVFFQTVVFFVIFYSSNPVYWKIALSFILLISLINYRSFISYRRGIIGHQKKKEYKLNEVFSSDDLVITNISMTYNLGIEKRKVFSEADATFSIGINIIRGPNGSGKSTLLKILKGAISPQSGKALYGEYNLLDAASFERPIFFIRQNPFDICAPNLTVIENLSTTIPGYSKIGINCSKSNVLRMLSKALDTICVEPIVGYDSSFWGKEARSLSGGEAQVICLYMSLLGEKPILLLDEPSTGLDDYNFDRLNIILKALSDKIIVIITSHDRRLNNVATKNFVIDDYNLKDESQELLKVEK